MSKPSIWTSLKNAGPQVRRALGVFKRKLPEATAAAKLAGQKTGLALEPAAKKVEAAAAAYRRNNMLNTHFKMSARNPLPKKDVWVSKTAQQAMEKKASAKATPSKAPAVKSPGRRR